MEMFEIEKLRPLIERAQLQEHRCIICGARSTGSVSSRLTMKHRRRREQGH
jgi:hypothetical protein